MEMELRREHERFDEFSDDTAPSIKELKQKIVTVERALAHMKALGLEPGESIDGDASPAESARDPWYRRVVPNRP